jgi:protein-L-isoaspartate(D-aspartate) O-methyltransferase
MAVDHGRERAQMVAEQLAARGISDEAVLGAIRRVPRHLFVTGPWQERAYDDTPLPIGAQQTISQPFIVGLMSEALALRGGERVLEVGTGSGYQAAILAELGARVVSVERLPELAAQAETVLRELGYADRVAVHVTDGTLGWPADAPYDAIVVTASGPHIPRPLVEQLKPGGALVLPMGDDEEQMLVRLRRDAGELVEEYLGYCRFVKLVGRWGWEEP